MVKSPWGCGASVIGPLGWGDRGPWRTSLFLSGVMLHSNTFAWRVAGKPLSICLPCSPSLVQGTCSHLGP